eukprot:UC4_evm3s813
MILFCLWAFIAPWMEIFIWMAWVLKPLSRIELEDHGAELGMFARDEQTMKQRANQPLYRTSTSSESSPIFYTPSETSKLDIASALENMSPKSIASIRHGKNIIQQLGDLISYENNYAWGLISSENAVSVYKMNLARRTYIKGEGLITTSPNDIFNILEKAKQTEWHFRTKRQNILDVYDCQTSLIQTVLFMDSMVTDREFLEIRRWERQGDNYLIATSGSGLENGFRPEIKNTVRGNSDIGGISLNTVANRPSFTKITVVISWKLNGWLSESQYQKIGTRFLLSYIDNLRRLLVTTFSSLDVKI